MNHAIITLLLIGVLGASCLAAPEAPPATQPTGETSGRLKRLQAGVAQFELTLSYSGQQDKPFYALLFHVPEIQILRSSPFHLDARLTEAEAAKVIDHLSADGFVARATDTSHGVNHQAEFARPTYCLTVVEESANGRFALFENLGWGPALLPRLDGLRASLPPDAAKEMDTLLTRLSGLRKEWEKAAPATARRPLAHRDRHSPLAVVVSKICARSTLFTVVSASILRNPSNTSSNRATYICMGGTGWSDCPDRTDNHK